MSDYTKVFDGAAKDSGSATVLGADHDTEFDAISTAVNSKADEVASATAGNIAELTSDGNLADSGIDSDNLDGLTGVVETRLVAVEAGIVPDAETNHYRAGWQQFWDNSSTPTALDIATDVTETTWETVGPTGSGATHIWTALDVLPSTARAVMLNIYINITEGASGYQAEVWGASNATSSPVTTGQSLVAALESNGDSGDASGTITHAIIACDSNQIFKIKWTVANETSIDNLAAYYTGFIND